MSSAAALILFALALVVCIAFDISILFALVFGYGIFFVYGRTHGHSAKALLRLSWDGIKTTKNVLLTFIFIGMLTAVWRACGTIAFIIYRCAPLIAPSTVLLLTFLLCSLVSVLTGTAFGTAATAGVICMTLANAMGIPPVLSGGAMLAGVYFGDRCSPMSTSALLVSELTKTDIYKNIRAMVKTAAVPFLASCVIYFFLGRTAAGEGAADGVWELFARHFDLGWYVAIPAALVLILSAFRVRVRVAMGVSVVVGCVLCLAVQGMDVVTLCRTLVFGYTASDAQLGVMMNGGGLVSMVRVAAIVSLSSSYSGIFRGTGLLDALIGVLRRFAARTSPLFVTLTVSLAAGCAACNQTLSIILTHQLCTQLYERGEDEAINLADTVVVIAPLIPWSIAGATPLTTVGAPTAGIAAAFYLFLFPLWRLLEDSMKKMLKK